MNSNYDTVKALANSKIFYIFLMAAMIVTLLNIPQPYTESMLIWAAPILSLISKVILRRIEKVEK